MSEFKIASNLDLSTDEAKAKLKELEKGNIKKKLELDTGNINKNIQNQVKEREKYEKNSLGNLEKSKTKTLDNLHRKRLKQEAEYQRAVSDSAKKTASDKIKQTEKEIANESKKLSRLGKSYADYVKGINSGFKFDRNTKELAKGFAQAEKDVQKIKNTINSIENPLAKSFKNTAQNQSDSILKSIRKNTMSSDNLRNIERRSASLQNYVKNIGKLDKIERKVGSKYFKAKDNLDGFSNIITQDRAKKISRNLSNKFDSIKPTTVSGTTNTLKEFNAELGKTEVQTKGLKKLDNLTRRLSSFENNLKPKEINKYRKALVDLSKADNIGSGNYMGRLKALDTQMTVASRYRSSMDRFRNDFRSSFLGTSVGYLAGAALRRQIGTMVETYKGLDASMTNVKKVAKAADVRTKKQIKGIQDWAINTGKQVGMSSADIQNSLATSIQSGMGSMKSSMAVARKSMILANVGDMNKDEATKAVNTLVKAFGITPLAKIKRGIKGIVKETTQLDDALNKINYLGNNYAISSAGVAEAIQNGGSVLSNYGISYADSMGLITAANEPLQNPKKVGNGLKSIAINFAGMAASAKDGKLQLNKTAKALSEIAGINVYKDKAKGQLKNMVQLLDELHPKWNRLNDDQRAGLSEAIAGKHRANVFQALMGNYEQFKKIRKEFAQGDDFGSAEKENAKYVDSIAGKANKLKETMTSVATSLFSTDMAKSGLNGLIKFGEGLEKVIKWADKTNTTLPVLMAGMAGLKGVFGALKEPIKDYETLLYGDSKTKNQPIWERMSNYTKDKKKISSSTKKILLKKGKQQRKK
ncbi:phage tail tape measure protein, TP901 family, core region [Peptostreptococcus anaerobius]|uniref:Phage tail tape measure protein, TP901 family, core region n=1 Tax=Peptostreptococcus anaerobius TaxID=1261 RepID=A0A379DK53_9FIRM|nr:phage tail tape measure protein [Peptostreptococcus anaerobius]SUB78760.1 phage tail tape measure protein, TP901 family, core region [Peptostreptococcus anaerobius]